MPDWEYILWNEENFDVNAVRYCREAYHARKYAFVTDYVRLWALKQYGGVYMDTDVEILKPLDDLLTLTAFTGYEGSKFMPPVTGIMASMPQGQWVTEQLAYYTPDRPFIMDDGKPDLTTNTLTITNIMKSNGFVPDGQYQVYKDMHIFPVDYFCPRQTTGEIILTSNTYCDHHFLASWDDNSPNKPWFAFLGQKNITRLIKLKRKILK